MRIDGAIQEVATELGLPFEVCKRAYLSSWEFIKTTAQALPLKEDLTDEQKQTVMDLLNNDIAHYGKYS